MGANLIYAAHRSHAWYDTNANVMTLAGVNVATLNSQKCAIAPNVNVTNNTV